MRVPPLHGCQTVGRKVDYSNYTSSYQYL